jgi:dihydropteroate synthase
MDQPFPWGQRTCIMGILNVTPDSFSGDGIGRDLDAAITLAKDMLAAGADVIDIGGESTAYWKAGYAPVDTDEELRRVLPVIERLHSELPRVVISIDTRKPEVARKSLASGASWLNDVEGVWDNGEMAELAAEHEAPFIIMHNKREATYEDVISEVLDDLRLAVNRAAARGVKSARILVDPGLGFGKTGAHNVELLRRMSELVSGIECPILVGPSRKRFLGQILGTPEQDRVEGTAAAVALAIAGGASAVRVHDVRQIARVVRVADAIVRGQEPSGKRQE